METDISFLRINFDSTCQVTVIYLGSYLMDDIDTAKPSSTS